MACKEGQFDVVKLMVKTLKLLKIELEKIKKHINLNTRDVNEMTQFYLAI